MVVQDLQDCPAAASHRSDPQALPRRQAMAGDALLNLVLLLVQGLRGCRNVGPKSIGLPRRVSLQHVSLISSPHPES